MWQRVYLGHYFWTAASLIAVTSMVGTPVSAAETPAIVRNRVVTVGGGKEVDAAVKVLAIDARPVAGEPAEIAVPPGKHALDIECTARVFVGMGTVDFPSQIRLGLDAEAGKIYQLDANVNVQGGCIPFFGERHVTNDE